MIPLIVTMIIPIGQWVIHLNLQSSWLHPKFVMVNYTITINYPDLLVRQITRFSIIILQTPKVDVDL